MKELSLHIMDIAQNSIRAEATFIEISIEENLVLNILFICIKDNGKGMDSDTLARSIDPFYTSRNTRKVGLGLSLLKQNAEMAGGSFTIESLEKIGTTVKANFQLNHIDRAEMGDLPGVITLLVGANPNLEFVYTHNVNHQIYIFDTREIKEALDNLPLNLPEVLANLKEMITENLKDIQAST